MNKNLVVEIFVPTKGAVGRGEFGTGYPVAQNRILTARHVIEPDDRDEKRPIEIRWLHPMAKDQGWIRCDAECVVWTSDAVLDVAVLACGFPEPILAETWEYPDATKPVDGHPWSGAGFAEAGGDEQDGEHRLVSVQGKMHSAADDSPQFELGADYPADVETGWQGLSGSPVISGGRNLGVIVACPSNFKATKLRATPLWKLLDDETSGFRKAIGFDTHEARHHAFRLRLIAMLEIAEPAMVALAAQFKPALQLTGLAATAQAQSIADALLDRPIKPVFEICNRAHRVLAGAHRDRAAKVIRDTLQLILPAVYDPDVVESVRLRKYDIQAAVIPLPTALRTVAEIVMAGADRRPTCYRSDGKRHPDGIYALPTVPELGFDGHGEAFAAAWHDQLANQFHPMNSAGLRKAFDDYVVGRFAELDDLARQRDSREYIDDVADELDYLAREEGITYYFILRVPPEAPARSSFKGLIAELKASYPAIVFLELDEARELERVEKKQYRSLSSMLAKDREDPQ